MAFEWVPSDENIEKCSTEQAKFIFEQGEKLLKDITDTNVLIVTRTTTLITITVGFMLALVGFLFSRYIKVETLVDAELITCFLTILYIFNLCRILVKNIQGQEYHVVGTEPKKLFTDPYFDEEQTQGEKMKFFYINEIAVCQDKIKMNIQTNDKRWALFNRALQSLLYTPLIIVFFFILVKILIFATPNIAC